MEEGAEEAKGAKKVQEEHVLLMKDLRMTVQGQQTALEILANLCCGHDDDDDSEDWEDDTEESEQVRILLI